MPIFRLFEADAFIVNASPYLIAYLKAVVCFFSIAFEEMQVYTLFLSERQDCVDISQNPYYTPFCKIM